MRGVYTGDLVDGLREGRGVLAFANGDKYDGEFRRGFREGHGVFTSERGTRVYDGDWRRSQRHGRGKERWLVSGDRYDGEYQDDAFHGRGVWARGSGSTYDGEFKNGRRHGRGRMTFVQPSQRNDKTSNSSNNKDALATVALRRASQPPQDASQPAVAVYDGEWRDGRMHGQGRYTRPDGSFYEGTWVDGQSHGFGREVNAATGEVFEGTWRQGQRHGDGTVLRQGRKRRGVWELGQRVKWTSAEVPIAK
ncbi:hypothetical protein ATCC90586_008960 [Pythium insidiosum]|nr:hypothetical protein ATCC90586_008960 [Pythium insidiosum]